jgi:hypothetical protein
MTPHMKRTRLPPSKSMFDSVGLYSFMTRPARPRKIIMWSMRVMRAGAVYRKDRCCS